MRALAVVVVAVLAFTVSTGSAQTKASELADATHDELEAEKHKAEQLKALLDVLTQPDRPQTSEAPAQDQKQRTARSSQPRPDEPSGVGIPAPAPRVVNEYQRLRDRVEQSRDPVKLTKALAEFVALHPQHRDARLLLGRVQIVAGDQLAAISTLAPLLRVSHPDWQPWFWTGTAYLSMGEVELARQNLDVSLSKNSGSVDVWVQLAVLEQELGNHAGALQYLAIAQRLDPRAAQTYLNKAYSFERLGRYEEALRAYHHFLVSDMKAAAASLRPTVLRRIAAIAGELDERVKRPG